jgi:hypothetical protein
VVSGERISIALLWCRVCRSDVLWGIYDGLMGAYIVFNDGGDAERSICI